MFMRYQLRANTVDREIGKITFQKEKNGGDIITMLHSKHICCPLIIMTIVFKLSMLEQGISGTFCLINCAMILMTQPELIISDFIK